MSAFDLFDPAPFVAAAEAASRPEAATKTEADLNPILCRAGWAAVPAAEHAVSDAASVASVAECQSGVAALAKLPRLNGVSKRRWGQLNSDAQSFERVWLDRAVALGWTVLEMFGCNPNPLAGRLDRNGLVMALAGRPISEIDEAGATIKDRNGVTMRFSRGFDRSAALPLWVAFKRGGK